VDVRKSSRRGIFESFTLRFILLRPFRCETCDYRYFGLVFAARIKEKEKASKLKFLAVPVQLTDGPENSVSNSIGMNPVRLDPGDSRAENVVQPASNGGRSRSVGGLVDRSEGRR
jgi:hypothetical protein